MRYFGISLQFFAVFINFYLFTYSTISQEGTYSVLRNSGYKKLGLDTDIFEPRGPGFSSWVVHGGTSLPEHSSFALNSQSASAACHHWSDKNQPFSATVPGFPHCYKHCPHWKRINLRRWGAADLPWLRYPMNSPTNTATCVTNTIPFVRT